MSAAPVKKACDACHRRKVRCSGGQPCKNCGHASLQCTYLAIPQKKGPKGSRAKVISEIRDNQQQNAKTPPSLKSSSSHDMERNPFDFNTSPMSPGYARNVDLLSQQTIDSCIDLFFAHLYPTYPIFNRQRLAALTSSPRDSPPEIYCLTAALCAFIMTQPGITLQGNQNGTDGNEGNAQHRHATLLVEEVERVRKTFDYVDSPTLHSVEISFFLFGAYFCLERSNQSWFHIREATTLAQLMLMHEEASYRSGDAVENMYKRRMYWLLLLTERAHAMERHRPLSLYGTIELPTTDEDPQEAPIIAGFLYLLNLFRLIDNDFMDVWNKAKAECSTTWLSELQRSLADALPPELECTENQAADVRLTQHWLRTMVWQMSITNGYLSSSSHDVAMTFKYPIQITQDLVRDIQSLSRQSMEVHGIGFIEKLFDVACTLTDVIACVPLDDDSKHSTEGPSEHLNQLLNLISRLRGGSSRYQPLLVAKVAENLPSLTSHALPSNIRTNFPPDQRNGAAVGHPVLTPSASSSSMQPPSPYTSITPYSEHSRDIMFETYSPSMSHSSDVNMTPITPPVAGMSHSPHTTFASHLQGHGQPGIHPPVPIPRTVPPGHGSMGAPYNNGIIYNS